MKTENQWNLNSERSHGNVNMFALMPDINLQDLYVSKKCAASILGICYRTLERWYNSGYINRIQIGGRIYFPKTELLRISQLYKYGISTLSGQNRPQSLSELYAIQKQRVKRRL